jgi:hypothetical protein
MAAKVAAGAIKALESMESLLGGSSDTKSGYHLALLRLKSLCRTKEDESRSAKRSVVKAVEEKKVSTEDVLETLMSALRPPKIPEAVRRSKIPPAALVQLIEDIDEADPSDWDPEPSIEREAKRCQALLLEIVRRAAHDWVLYRHHSNLEKRALANQAYTWLFEEEPGHTSWKERDRALFRLRADKGEDVLEVGTRRLTSFLSICEIVGIDPDAVRARARKMTPESITRTGRHAERRKPAQDTSTIEAHGVMVDIDLDSLDAEVDYDDTPDYW